MILTNDLIKGVDISGIPYPGANDFNNLVDLANPGTNAGLLVISYDTALNVAEVPDANANGKWKRYIWLRMPFDNSIPKIYAWNDAFDNNVTFLKWKQLLVDISALQALITAANATANTALETAATAVTTANAANANVASAQNDATTALANSTTAVNTATTANTNAAAAVVTANAAQTSLTNYTSVQHNVNNVLLPGASKQLLRTKLDASGVEWFNRNNNVYVFVQLQASGAHAGASVIGKNQRIINSAVYSNGTDVALNLADNSLTLAVAGTYRIKFKTCGVNTAGLQACLEQYRNAVLVAPFYGTSHYGKVIQNCYSELEVIVNANAADTLKFFSYHTDAQATYGMGRSASASGVAEYFDWITAELIG